MAIEPVRITTYPAPRRARLVNRHVGLTQAYELRDTASEQANQVRECPANTLDEMATRARLAKPMAQFSNKCPACGYVGPCTTCPDCVKPTEPHLTYYIQTDPRGASLYILKRSDVNGCEIDQVYNRGLAVY